MSHYHDEAIAEERAEYENRPYICAEAVSFFRFQSVYRLSGMTRRMALEMACLMSDRVKRLSLKERYHAINAACERMVG